MKNLAERLKDPKRHNGIDSAVQQCDAPERRELILQISETHLLLAANIIKNCAQDHDLIAQVSAKAVQKAKQAQRQKNVAVDALLCLIVLKKHSYAADLMFIKDKKDEEFKNSHIEELKSLESETANTDVIAIFIAISPNYEIALQFFEAMPSLGIQASVNCYGNLIGKSPDYSTALHWYNQILAEGLTPIINVYGNLISKSPDYATALNWYKKALAEGLTPDIHVYHNMIFHVQYLPDPKQRNQVAKRYYEKALQEGIQFVIWTYKYMIYFSLSYAEAFHYFSAMEQAGIQADEEIFEVLQDKAKNQAEKRQFKALANKFGIG